MTPQAQGVVEAVAIWLTAAGVAAGGEPRASAARPGLLPPPHARRRAHQLKAFLYRALCLGVEVVKVVV